MLSIAAGFAESRGAEGIVIAAHAGDHAIYPDCREEFLEPMARAVREGTYARIELLRPFVSMDKASIVRRGAELGVDFGATWCAACEELLRHTFSDPAVRAEARRFVTVRVDATESTPALDELQARHHVRGLPTVLLLDTNGREVARIAEFVPAPRMLQLMRAVH